MRRVLILTASYGEGHNSAARALRSAFNGQPDTQATLVDLFDLCAPRFDRLARRAYLRLINHAPGLWAGFYRWLDRSPLAPRLLDFLPLHTRRLARVLREEQPVAICCTYPVYPWLLARLRTQGASVPPVFTVITDALSINSLWFRAPSTGWFVTDPDSAAHLRAAGVTPDRVQVSGFPVALAFADRDPGLHPPDPAVSPERRILHMINSGRSRALDTAAALLQRPGWHITFTAGRDAGLRHRLEEMSHGSPARATVLGWTDRIPELLMTHHVVISKAGGATTQESINALCPMIVNQIVPGQEEGNWELLRRHGAGALATTPAQVVAALDAAFAGRGEVWHRWREGLTRLARPDAARDIASTVLDHTQTPEPARR